MPLDFVFIVAKGGDCELKHGWYRRRPRDFGTPDEPHGILLNELLEKDGKGVITNLVRKPCGFETCDLHVRFFSMFRNKT